MFFHQKRDQIDRPQQHHVGRANGQIAFIGDPKSNERTDPPTADARIMNCRMVRVNGCEISAGIRRNPKAINGPTLNTAMDTVNPMSK